MVHKYVHITCIIDAAGFILIKGIGPMKAKAITQLRLPKIEIRIEFYHRPEKDNSF